MRTRRPILQKTREGDVFAVPLLTSGWAIGVVGRCSRRKLIKGVYGFFFGPKQDAIPAASALSALDPRNAVHQEKFLARAISDGEWPVLGQLPGWDRDQWTLPCFVTAAGQVVAYDDDDIDASRLTGEWLRGEEMSSMFPDSMAGGAAVQIKVTRLLDPVAAVQVIGAEPVRHPPIRCQEGDVLAIPLSRDSRAAAVVTRVTTGLVSQNLLLYCFRPRSGLEWEAERVASLLPSGAINRIITSSTSVVSGVWPIVGRVSPWTRSDWRMTAGVQRIPGANAAWRITLSDDDPMDRIDATPVEEEEAKHLSDVSFVPAELVPRRIRESLLLSG